MWASNLNSQEISRPELMMREHIGSIKARPGKLDFLRKVSRYRIELKTNHIELQPWTDDQSKRCLWKRWSSQCWRRKAGCRATDYILRRVG